MYAAVLFVSFFVLLTLLGADTVKSDVGETGEMAPLTVAVPAYNEEDSISMTLESILDASYPEKRIIVVNDGSEDSTGDIADRYDDEHDEVEVIHQQNQGKGAALNAALEKSETELFGCVDADSELTESSLRNIVADMDSDAAGIASTMKVRNPSNLLENIQQIEYSVNMLSRKIMGMLDAIHVTPGALSVYRTGKLKEYGGFDESSIVEDQEICWRLQNGHEKLQHSRKGVTYTIVPNTLRSFFRQRRRWWAGSFRCIINYRNILFNPRYGDFGMFMAPSKLVTAGVSTLSLFVILYVTLTPFIATFQNLKILGLDAFNLGLQFSAEKTLNWLYWVVFANNVLLLSALGAMLMFSLSIVYLAMVHNEIELGEVSKVGAAIYVFYFFLFNGFMTLVAVKNVLSGEKKW